MEQKLIYAIPTYTQFDHCRNAVETIIHTSTRVPDGFLIVDNSETAEGYKTLADLIVKYDFVDIQVRTENILAGAWNDMMRYAIEHDAYMIIANDDVTPHPHSIQALVDAAINRPDIAMWNGSGHSGNSYSFFLLRNWAYKQVGEFDENFKPAYFEDNDFDRRIKLAGLIREEVPTATFEHVGSATMKNMRDERIVQHHASFVKNQRYFQRKWGGTPAHEQYEIPFERPYFDLADL